MRTIDSRDIRRWMIAENEGVMQGKFYGIQISKIDGSSEVHYKPYVFENVSGAADLTSILSSSWK